MTQAFDQAVEEVADELRNNRSGAYAYAVRIQATAGHNADKLMAAAVEVVKNNPGGGAPVRELVEVDFPEADQLKKDLLEESERLGALGPDTLVLVDLFVDLVVAERQRILERLGG